MLQSISERTPSSTLSAQEFFQARNAANAKEDSNGGSKSYTLSLSNAGKEALGSFQGSQNTDVSDNPKVSFTFKSANNSTEKKQAEEAAKTQKPTAGALPSGTTVSVYTEAYGKDEEKIPGTSEKIMVEITQKNGTVQNIAITENTVISEDASGQLTITEVPRTVQQSATKSGDSTTDPAADPSNPDTTQEVQYAPSNLKGTDGNDIIINIFEGTGNIQTGEGDDTVISFHDVDAINLGNGNNTLQAMGGNYKSVSAGNGNNLLESMSKNSAFESISLGDGSNNIQLDSIGTLNMGNGNNELSTTSISDLHAGDGSNSINAGTVLNALNVGNGSNSVSVDMLAGNMKAGDGNNNIRISDLTNNSQLALGIGSNKINIKTMHEGSGINSADGDQNISVETMRNASLNLGNGDHDISIDELERSKINTGNGDTFFRTESMSRSELNVGTGNNSFFVKNLAHSTVNIDKNPDKTLEKGKNAFYIDGEMKNSEINSGNGDTTFNIEKMDKSTINSDIGNDVFNLGEVGGGNINTGEGNDTINVDGSIWGHQNVEPLVVNMGEGDNTLSVKGHANRLVFDSGSGNDSVRIGSFVSDSSINTGYGEDDVSLNPNSFVYKSDVTFGINEEEQSKLHGISSGMGENIQASQTFAETNPEDKAKLDETLKKSPFYTPTFSIVA